MGLLACAGAFSPSRGVLPRSVSSFHMSQDIFYPFFDVEVVSTAGLLPEAKESRNDEANVNAFGQGHVAALVPLASLLVTLQAAHAKDGEIGIFEGRIASLVHPATMAAPFFTSLYSSQQRTSTTSTSSLEGVGVGVALLDGFNTYMRAGKLFPGPQLYAGMGIVGLWVAAATLVPAMQKGNETARLLHIAMNMINLGLFDGRSTPASASLSKLSSLATLLREGGGAGSEVGGGGSTSAVA